MNVSYNAEGPNAETPIITVYGMVSTYAAEIRLAACSDRDLMEQGKEKGRLERGQSVTRWATRTLQLTW